MSKSILIVEDEETLRDSIKRIFTKEGYAVEAVDSAEKGLALLESAGYDVIISDIILPGMDGIEILTKVREQVPDQVFIVVNGFNGRLRMLRLQVRQYCTLPSSLAAAENSHQSSMCRQQNFQMMTTQ